MTEPGFSATEFTPGDYETIAGMLQVKRKFADALAWVERGLELQKGERFPIGGRRLADMKRHLLKNLGRGEDALNSAWAEFQACVPKAGRAAWHEKAMEAAGDGDLASLIDLWVQAKETDRLVERLRSASDRKNAHRQRETRGSITALRSRIFRRRSAVT